ncbi:Cytochrome P450 52A1 OS=Candida tropicalis GN=CYP52A1 PE=1 SV=3 [Rhizoctonia solani AG-1 IB]|uniref:Cytochrome P450 52A1 n=1 Tax=Thanatephorus cucumeris (strain AG1-IB / isolate 7/3/14) TaxID=1108050 RepID=A0A0B7FU43_THACB|nr:Cytochrome P450 52A1 OS=Candida tropicalis GN=CYP52A1 PE=1 SV=3 [Rhizoctonia solani AG-1 IB]
MSSQSNYWGAGTSIVLRRFPRLLLPPTNISRPALAASLWLLHKLTNRAIKSYRRNQERRQLGPDVIEVPSVEFKLPWNIDFIPFANEARERGYVNDAMAPFLDSVGNIFNLTLFGEDFIFTNEPEHVKAMLSTDFGNFVKGRSNHEKMFSLLGEGVFNVDGDMWKFHRSMTRPYFSRERITHFELFARHSDAAISKLLAHPHGAVDFQDLVSKFTMDSASEFLFGINVRSLDQSLPLPHTTETEGNRFSAAFTGVQAHAVVRFSYGALWPYMELFSDRTRKDMSIIEAFIQPILEAKLGLKKKGGLEDEEEKETLIDHLVKLTDDEKLIKDELLNIMVAGRDTTASTLTFACYMLATNPHVLSKLRAEVLDHVGTSSHPTIENFKEMKYLRAVINEVLRVYPPVPLNQRECVNSTVFNSGGKQYFIPAGAAVIYSVLFMHTRKDLWGDDAEVFDPERWLDDRYKKYVLPNPFIFLPFNAGPRICLGQQFAYNEISFFLIRLLQRVDQISLAPDAQPSNSHPPKSWAAGPGRRAVEKIWPKAHLTLYSYGGLWVRMKEARN